MKKKLILILSILLGFVLLIVIILNITPFFDAMLIRKLFNNPDLAPINNYESIKDKFTVIENIEYPSLYKENVLDIYLPKNDEKPHPVIIWVHGGGFVGGDKTDLKYYGEALAVNGYAVILFNYSRGPETKYPTPLLQVDEVYDWILSQKDTYNLDIENLIFAGDSAGAQIASQFVTIQTNIKYSEITRINQSIPKENIKGMLLYCGVYDIKMITESNSSKLVNYFLNKAGWAYFGKRDWMKSFQNELSIINYINSDFPPTFITDGNTFSFEKQARKLAEVLVKNTVEVKELYFPEDTTTMHEYQFKMNTPQGEKAYEYTLEFLNSL